MRTALFGALLLGLLGGCAARGPMTIDCPPFAALRHDLPMTPIEREIHGVGQRAMGLQAQESDLEQRLDAALGGQRPQANDGRPPRPPAILLLSGGGQWGAFGAGWLNQLHKDGRLPRFTFITGVSTGSLQSLFVALDTPDAYDALIHAYSPAKESDIVDRGPKWQAVVSGSFAGVKPLRRRIEAALCPDDVIDDPLRRCRLDDLRDLAHRKAVLIGFVHAASGKFQYVDAVEVAAQPRRVARACLTGAALASSAMPVSFEQVRINGESYYDGGVRASVFEAGIAAATQAVIDARNAMLEASGQPLPPPGSDPVLPIYVIRNGPTTVDTLARVDTDADALTAAERAQAIVVNQLEVGSIAAIRIEHPVGTLKLATANGWDTRGGCTRPPGVMFDPVFMACLRAWGASKAGAVDDPWINLSPIAVSPP